MAKERHMEESESNARVRTFLALELPENVRQAAAETRDTLAREFPEVRWVAPESLHITLAFLGKLDPRALDAARRATAVTASQTTTFALGLGQTGTFGSPRAPRVVWLGLAGAVPQLVEMQQRLADMLAHEGFPPEARAFTPHLTLARVKTRLEPASVDRLQRTLASLHTRSTDWHVEYLSVMRSELQRGGSRYTQLAAYPLHA